MASPKPRMVHPKIPGDVWAQLSECAHRRRIPIQSALRDAIEHVVVASRRFHEWTRLRGGTVTITICDPHPRPQRAPQGLPERRGVELPRGLWRAFKAEAMALHQTTGQLLTEAARAYAVRTDLVLGFCAVAESWPEADAQQRGTRHAS